MLGQGCSPGRAGSWEGQQELGAGPVQPAGRAGLGGVPALLLTLDFSMRAGRMCPAEVMDCWMDARLGEWHRAESQAGWQPWHVLACGSRFWSEEEDEEQ